MPANKLVIPIDKHLHIVIPAVVHGSIDDVIGGVVVHQVLHVGDPVLGEIYGPHVLDGFVHGGVVGVVVDEDYVVVFVFLLHDRHQHSQVTVVLDVVAAQHRHAEGGLLLGGLVLVDAVLLRVLLVFP